MPKRTCIVCGALTNGSRCPRHKVKKRGRAWQIAKTVYLASLPPEQRLCAWCGHRGSVNNPLTVDEVRPRSKGNLTPVYRVLCLKCNSRRGNGRLGPREKPWEE